MTGGHVIGSIATRTRTTLLLAAAALGLTGPFLPWAVFGQRLRNLYELGATGRQLGVTPDALGLALTGLIVLLLVPVAAALLAWARLAIGFALVAGAASITTAVFAVLATHRAPVGIVSWWGPVVLVVAGCVYLAAAMAGLRDRRTRPPLTTPGDST